MANKEGKGAKPAFVAHLH